MANTVSFMEAITILRTNIMDNQDIYNGFIASIESAINEAKPYTKEHNLAVAILNRVVGIERGEQSL
ncbi:hypothetical protein V8Q34_14760 [Blautia sp. JLR.GB0024]|uniref:hypothetical protein n=1 Tax=Blautia sp. JLR.GB0024 TaxID=3123295 RepID=UPI00300616B8